MKECPSHDTFAEILKEIRQDAKETRRDIKKLREHFDLRHDKNIQIMYQNKSDIAVMKIKQYAIAALAGMGGGQIQEILKKIIF